MNKRNTLSRLAAAFLAALMLTSLMAPAALAEESSSSSSSASGSGEQTPPPPSGTGPVKTAYTVQTAAGQELQKIEPGEKCQIVVGIFDDRFNENHKPGATDSAGNIVNAKITSTTSFASPSLGDIYCSTPVYSADGVRYSVIFNDITYQGGSNTLSFDLSYIDQSVEMKTVSVDISQCNAGAGGTTSSIQPTIMVKDSNYGAASVNAGDTFTLNLTSYNTSSTLGVSNVVTTLTLPETLTLAGGSNSVMTSQVAAGGSFTDTFTLMAQPGAETGVANITVNYTYYTSTSESQLTSSQIITVSVVQPDRFSFSSLDVPTEMYTGEENTISLGFVNKGKGILYNLSAEISGNLSKPGQTQYLGNLQPGAEGSVDFIVSADEPGTVSGTITLTYEDITGKQTTQTKEYSVEMMQYEEPIMDMPITDDPSMVEPESSGMPVWGWVVIGLAVVVAAVVAVKVVKKRKALKEQQELEDEDADN
ncbi:MAG: hypothetical protein MSH10_03120 [Pygmaiobacter massiliensis]|nr:hypothetical protein [Pygmaiobacter massiliensis]